MAVQKNVMRVIRISLGSLSLVLGVIGLVLPILQGWFFLALGVILLSKDIPLFRRLSDWMHKRFPIIDRSNQKARERLRQFKTRWFKSNRRL